MKKLLTAFLFLSATAHAQWPQVTQTTRPWTRWWWPGSAVDEKNLATSLQTYSKAGFGGVEIVPIYGAIGYEPKYISYLSPDWMKMLDFASSRNASTNCLPIVPLPTRSLMLFLPD